MRASCPFLCLLALSVLCPVCVLTPHAQEMPGTDSQLRNPPPGGGPQNDQTFGAVSSDGLRFEILPGPLFDHASVPNVIELPKDSTVGRAGTLILYFVDFSNRGGSREESVSMAASSDGRTWTDKLGVTLKGQAHRGRIVDPSAVVLPDGRIRLFYFGPESTQGDPMRESGDHKIYSAISEDGLKFRAEEGVRYQAPAITDPDVVRIGGQWFLFLSHGMETLLARSADGTTFTADASFKCRIGGVPGAVALPDGKIRIFATARDGIVSALYTPRGNLVPEEGLRVPRGDVAIVADPSCIRRADGTYYLVFKKRPGTAPPLPPIGMP